MPELPQEELRRLAAGLREFINYQRRLGLQLVEGALPVGRSKPEATVAVPRSPQKD